MTCGLLVAHHKPFCSAQNLAHSQWNQMLSPPFYTVFALFGGGRKNECFTPLLMGSILAVDDPVHV